MVKKLATQPRQVAVVEDDGGVREAIQNLLSSANHPSRSFGTVEGFLRSKNIRRFGCLIVDAQLSGMSGIALHEHLLSRGIAIPTIIITADEERGRRLRARGSSQNLVAVLAKPFDGEEFLRAVRSALNLTTSKR